MRLKNRISLDVVQHTCGNIIFVWRERSKRVRENSLKAQVLDALVHCSTGGGSRRFRDKPIACLVDIVCVHCTFYEWSPCCLISDAVWQLTQPAQQQAAPTSPMVLPSIPYFSRASPRNKSKGMHGMMHDNRQQSIPLLFKSSAFR